MLDEKPGRTNAKRPGNEKKICRKKAKPSVFCNPAMSCQQRKVIKYNHLVANMIILHNVVGMTKVLQELRDEGTEITLEILGGLAPFRTAHINRFGDYTLDFRRKIGPLNFDATIIPMES